MKFASFISEALLAGAKSSKVFSLPYSEAINFKNMFTNSFWHDISKKLKSYPPRFLATDADIKEDFRVGQ
jgi:hypothetical protein